MTKTGAADSRFIIEGSDHDWRVTLVGARNIRDKVGVELFAAFLKAFMGVERLTVLLDLMHLTHQGLAEGSLRHRRNIRSLGFLIQSTLVELADALNDINNQRVVASMNDPNLWAPLEAKRRLWDQDKQLRAIRNGIGHHLGERAEYVAGLTTLLEKSDDLTFVIGEGRRRIDDEQDLAWNARLSGLGLKSRLGRVMVGADHEHAADLSLKALDEAHEELWFAWKDVLQHAGVVGVDATSEHLLEMVHEAAAAAGMEPLEWIAASAAAGKHMTNGDPPKG